MKKYFVLILQSLFFFTLFFQVFISQTNAKTIYLDENFDDGLADGWIESAERGDWTLESGIYIGTVTLDYPEKPTYSYYPSIPNNNYIFEADVKSTKGVDKAIMFRFNSISKTYNINLRSGYGPNGSDGKDINLVKVTPNKVTILEKKFFENFEKEWYRLKVIVKDNNFQIFVGEELVIDFVDQNNPILTGTVGLQVWPGSYAPPGFENITTLHYDNVLVQSAEEEIPLILLPGMTACWSRDLSHESGTANWYLMPLALPYYQNLMSSLEDANLQKDQDWFLFCYDWRQPLENSVQKLHEFIKNNTDPPHEVNLVGHSMGGLISRLYAQNHPEKVSKLVALGSPYQGAVRAYPAWEGGQLWEYEGVQKLIMELYLSKMRAPGEHQMNTIRRVFPSLKDILPTFNFLVEKGSGTYKDITTHHQQNDTMNAYNGTLTPETKAKMAIIYGHSHPTLDTLKLHSLYVPRANWVHQVRGLWEDGEPIHTCPTPLCEYTDGGKDYSSAIVLSDEGDKTVLAKSAQIDGVSPLGIDEVHSDLPKNSASIQHIFNVLNIPGAPSSLPELIFNKVLAFWIRSPAQITVTDADGNQAGAEASGPEIANHFFDPEGQFLLIPNPLENIYQISVTGTGEGSYRLMIGHVDEADEVTINEYSFPTNPGKTDHFELDLTKPELQLENPDGSLSLASARENIQKLLAGTGPICDRQKINLFFDFSERFIKKGQFKQSAQYLKVAFLLLNRCFFNLSDEKLISLLPEYESAANSLAESYAVCAAKGNLRHNPKSIKRNLSQKEKVLIALDKMYEKRVKNGIKISPKKAILFEKLANLIEEGQKALPENQIAKAYLLDLQTVFFISKLR